MSTAPQPAAPAPVDLSELVVLNKADLQRLIDAVSDLWDSASEDGCEAPYFVADMTHMQAARDASALLRQCKSLDQALRRVDGEPENGLDPILVVLPAGVSDKAAVGLMDAAILGANQDTDFGKDGGYFEALQTRLGASGVAIAGGIEELRSRPWDADAFAGPDEDDASGDWLRLVFDSSEDDPDQIDPVARLDQEGEPVFFEPIADVAFVGFCTQMHVLYPHGDKYGVPEAATDRGGRSYLREYTNLGVHKNLEVYAVDTGDDSAGRFSFHAMVHKDCMRPVEQPADRPREGGL